MAQNRWEIPELDLVVVADGPYIQIDHNVGYEKQTTLVGHDVILHAMVVQWDVRADLMADGSSLVGLDVTIEDPTGNDLASNAKARALEVKDELVHAIKQAKFMARSFDKGR